MPTRPAVPGPAPAPPPALPEVSPLEAPHRVLLGQGQQGAEARIYFNRGPLAGSEWHLHAEGRSLSVSVLTAGASPRQTLGQAMSELERRLGRRGISVDVSVGARASTERARRGVRLPASPETSAWEAAEEAGSSARASAASAGQGAASGRR